MEKVKKILKDSLNINFIQATVSNPKKKDGAVKVRIRPVLIREALVFQFETHQNNQAFHENFTAEEAVEKIMVLLENFKQLQFDTK